MDPRFGRCEGFILFDTEDKSTLYLPNDSQRNLAQGAGIKTAKMIVDEGAEVLITGQLGPNAAQVMGKTGVKIYACSRGTVEEAIQALSQNKLEVLSENTIQSGPGKMGGRGLGGGGRGRRGDTTGPKRNG